MGLGHGANLLAYVLPVLRLLGLHQVEVPAGDTFVGSEELPPLSWTPPVPGGLPEGLATLLRQARREADRPSPLLIDVPNGRWCFGGHEGEQCLETIPPPPENDEDAPDRALCDLVGCLDSDDMGHLLLADWLEDWLGPCPQADALRLSQATPPGEGLIFHSFGWRWLDRDAILYLAGVLRRESSARRQRAGFLIGLLYRRDGIARRWARWVPPEVEGGLRPLARELGVDVVE